MVSWALALIKIFYDRELAIAEVSVKPANIVHNASLILGKQIIHILPEGLVSLSVTNADYSLVTYSSAMLNMEQKPLCLSASRNSLSLSINMNQTNPILVELLRIDLDTNMNETIIIAKKELNRLKKQSKKALTKKDKPGSLSLQFSIQKTGLYRLHKVVDESNLEVRRKKSDTLVVPCPAARVKAVPRHKCKGDLSNFNLEVEATPPFKVKYTKTVNRERYSQVVLSVHPENLTSPLAPQENLGNLGIIAALDAESTDVSWARAQTVNVPLNESLGVSGQWEYSVDEVHDACGNMVDYSSVHRKNRASHESRKDMRLGQTFVVHERPRAAFRRNDPKAPLLAPKGKPLVLPMQFESGDVSQVGDHQYAVSYLFTPFADLRPNQEHAEDAILHKIMVSPKDRQMQIVDPGLYSLMSVWTSHCTGEVMEPSSCLLLNPSEPDLDITSEEIPDKCAGSSIGLHVHLSMVGTPPFRISYQIRRSPSGTTSPHVMDIEGYQTRLDLKPSEAGDYKYEFMHISDSVYKSPRSLEAKKLILEQAVKPPAFAAFSEPWKARKACVEESVSAKIQLRGEAPWTLEYEIVHKGQRQKLTEDKIERSPHVIKTKDLMDGGVYSLLLTSVTDRLGCKVLVEDEMRIEVGLQKPKAAFGQLDSKRSISALFDKQVGLPLRLQGEPPWTITYRKRGAEASPELSTTHHHSNDQIKVDEEGTFELLSVKDKNCPGSIDMVANQFVVHWIPKPAISVNEASFVRKENESFIKRDVCENDEDTTEISFSGTAPYTVEYNQNFQSDRGTISGRSQQLTSGLHSASIKMETAKAGLYEYKFSRLGDNSYSQAARGPVVLTIQQRVLSKPSARFTDVGKTYRYCMAKDGGNEVLPIILSGADPFHLEIDIRHHATNKP